MNKECELCIKRKTIYCPNSSKCMETENKPYYQNRVMLLEENKQLKDQLKIFKQMVDLGVIELDIENKEAIVYNDLRIRKLTPREAFRLMGVKDEDYDNCARNQSNASLYHLAGDSTVVNILCEIFKQML